jgi:hypothetical protein
MKEKGHIHANKEHMNFPSLHRINDISDADSQCRPWFRRLQASVSVTILAATLTASVTAAPAAPPPAAPPTAASALDASCCAKVGPALHESGGMLTPEVRDAYLTWGENTVQEELRQAHQSVPDDCLAEVHSDPVLLEAMFGTAYPPDASILQNYAAVRRQMGDAFMAKYRSLAIAIAVAKRTKGVETADETQAIGRDYQPGFWVDESLHAPTSDAEKTYVGHIADFLAQTRAAALDVYQDPALQARLKDYLSHQGVEAGLVAEVGQSVPFGERLKYALVLLHQRPAARDPKPSTVEWLHHLVQIYEATPQSTPDLNGRPMPWPLFPLDSAPWPLLMPLAHSVPLSEADYMWAAFQGENGADRYHTYGPYRDDAALMPDSLRPSRWFWDAWPDEIVHGGECIPISKSTVNLYSGLGKPAMWSGQPGHSNLISFQRVGDQWTAEIEQHISGPDETSAQWYFDEDENLMPRFRGLYNWAGAEYQLGLALGMNRGVASYMDTRIAANIFRALPDTAQRTLGLKLLQSALTVNPYNPEIWYRFASLTPDPGQEAALIDATLNEGPVMPAGAQAGPASEAAALRDPDTASRQYWQTVAQFVARYGVLNRTPPRAEPDMRRAYAGVKNVPGITAADAAAYADRFAAMRLGHDEAADLVYDRNLAADGDPYGELRMGQRFRDGDDVVPSDSKAEDFLFQSALQGEAAAAVLLDGLHPSVPQDRIRVTGSSVYSPTQAAQHLIDGSGMTGVFHDNAKAAETMWQTEENPAPSQPAPDLPPSPAWVRFDFTRPTTFDALLLWNLNQPSLTDRGFRRVRIYGMIDGSVWVPLTATDVIELPQASGQPNALPIAVRNAVGGRPLKSVIIAAETVGGNYGSACYGLSAVRFLVRRVPDTIPASSITVTPSSVYSPVQLAQHLIDGSGMQGLLHDNATAAETMWQTSDPPAARPFLPGLPPSPAWVRFDFAHPTKLAQILVWNHNQATLTDRGFRKIQVFVSSDHTHWHPLATSTALEIPRATGLTEAEPTTIENTAVDVPITSVIIAASVKDGNWGSSCYGLSAVRFVVSH